MAKHSSVPGRSRILQMLAEKMSAGMSQVDAANEILQEMSPGPPFDLERRKQINNIIFDTTDAAKIVNAHNPPKKWQVKSLDVWGNEEDGFEVNQEFNAGEIEIPAMCDDACLLKLMKEGGFMKDNVRTNQVEFDSSGEGFIELRDAKNGEPLYFLYES